MSYQIDYVHRFSIGDNIVCETISGKKFSAVIVAALVLDRHGYPGYRVRSIEDPTMEIDVGQIQVSAMATTRQLIFMDRQPKKATYLKLLKGGVI